ncbi:C4-dicarboxylic acid transporter DauA [Permianibacter sp. IMCC34836]|uniref:C4-dicarboxylic acid transporter DauA n=1 Tax=Permianibacter fluminis TaxID=2738515 RepID=UPI001552FCF5|nr:C4-dicarboxylic acid transporter DauA [Permianibacter fluminis]NQD35729.1 C4-dicarboxylic acid transporter DauA [Permianibacter fluminis]
MSAPPRLSLPIATALRESLRDYNRQRFTNDALAGITVGLIAIPLAMALAIASGVAPQYGLYTAIVAGIVIALTGGSRVNVSGPTAAFVVILLPVTQQFGLPGLLLATMLAGFILIGLGVSGLGKLVEFIPYPVLTGFTSGIAIVLAALQLKDLLGIELVLRDAHFLPALGQTLSHLPATRWQDLLIGMATLSALILWPRLKLPLPGHLAALMFGTALALLLQALLTDFSVATIGTRFSYDAGGVIQHGIPSTLPHWQWPWQLTDGDHRFTLSLDTVRALIGPAFAIAMLSAIESLLCAVVSDGLSGFRHDPNGELIGQGLGNVIAPLFGGITATAAIARTAANVRSGASSPIASVIHALTVLAALLVLGPLLQHIPMATLAAMLVMVAWNMSDAHRVIEVLKFSPRADAMVLLICLLLTVIFDMVIAVEVGMLLAAVLFIKRMTELSDTALVPRHHLHSNEALPPHVAVYDINGPLFFGAAEKAMHTLWRIDPAMTAVILDMQDVPVMDLTAIVALESLIADMQRKGIAVRLVALNERLQAKLVKAGLIGNGSWARYSADVHSALGSL